MSKVKLTRKIIAVTSMLLCGILTTGTIIANENKAVISDKLGTPTFKIIQGEGSEDVDSEYFKSEYTNVKDLRAAGKKTASQVVEEGVVLLKNENALPLAKNAKVTLVGAAAYNPVYGGTGSGSISTADAVNIVDSLTKAGVTVNPVVQSFYESNKDEFQRKSVALGGFGNNANQVNDANWSRFNEVEGSFSNYSDAAIMVIGRVGGEGVDLINKSIDGIDNNDGLGKDYLGLTENELSIMKGLKALKDAGKIKKIVVLVNYASVIEADFIKDPSYGVDAAMWIGALGVGGEGLGKVLSGAVSPSGRISDTVWMNNAMNPVNVNYGRKFYSNASELGVPGPLSGNSVGESTMDTYTVYQEGMYLGYKYTETRYEDLVLGTKNVGDYKYNDVVAYPFGYGLTYASFETSDISVKKTSDREYTVSVKVTNVSTTDVSGKYSVPIYVSKPYTDYSRNNNIQVPSVELIDFVKTKELKKGQSEVVTAVLDEKYFASYDAWNAKTYVLQEGDYYVCVGGDAHEATNNLLEAKKANGINIDKSKMIGEGSADKVAKFNLSFNKDKYAVSDAVSSLDGVNKLQITNLFDFADINRYEGRGDNKVDYYNRDHWDNVSLDIKDGYVKLKMTEQMAKDVYAQTPEELGVYTADSKIPDKYKQPIQTDDTKYPTYGKSAGLLLVNMIADDEGNEIAYNDPLWNTFLDQLTWDETVLLCTQGGHITARIDSVAKPETKDSNGPNGFGGWEFSKGYFSGKLGLAYRTAVKEGNVDEKGNVIKDKVDPELNNRPTGFPSNATLAATMNKELATGVGNIIGNDGIWVGCAHLYGIGLNIHRSPYLGRTCEYYSEDGMLTGIIGTYESAAIEKHGVHVLNKHCALNDQEDNRHGVSSWISEQALREIYLRAFELPIVKGNAYGTMASFSRFGTQAAAACRALGTDFLKGECGMKGFIITDAYGDMDGSQNVTPYFEQVYGTLIGGSDLPDKNVSVDHFAKYKTGYGNVAWAMRESAKRVLYSVAHSNAMNGFTSTTRVVPVTPWWQATLVAMDIVFGTAFVAMMAWGIVDMLKRKEK